MSWRLTVLDLVVVHVLGSGGVLADILILSQLINEDFAAIPAVGLGEAVLRSGLLDGEGQLAEGGVRLLAIERLGQGGQVCKGKWLVGLLLLLLILFCHC